MIRNARVLGRLMRNRRLSSARLEALRRDGLRDLVRHAWRNVPFYRDKFDAAGVHPDDIRGLDDLQRIPLTTRAELAAAPARRRVAAGLDPDRLEVGWTSGSSGASLAVYLTRPEIRMRQAVHFRSLLAMGFRARDHLVRLSSERPHRPGLHERLGLFRSESLPATLSMDEQYRRLQRLQPSFLWVHPSVFLALCEHVGRPLDEWLSARAVISSTEMLPEAQRRSIAAELGAEVFNCYGAVEFGRIAHECRTHEGLHVADDQLIVEILRDGCPAAPGEPGTVVVTSLIARAAPMIRYQLGDVGRFTGSPCSCGSPFRLIGQPEGRFMDMIVLPSGRRCSHLSVDMWVFFSVVSSHYRVIQHRRDFLEVLLKRPGLPLAEAAARLRARQAEFLEEEIPFEVRAVDEIPPGDGKYRSFVSRLDARERLQFPGEIEAAP